MFKTKIFFTAFLGLILPIFALAYSQNDVRLNEFMPLPESGETWIELRSNLSDSVDLAGWEIVTTSSSTVSTTTLGTLVVPPLGLVYLDVPLPADGALVTLFDPVATRIDAVGYGLVRAEDANYLGLVPGLGQSAVSLGGPWMPTGSEGFVVSKGWFNFNPTEASILAGLPSGVVANLGDSSDWTKVSNLFFERAGMAKIIWPGTFNLTGQDDVSTLTNLATNLSLGLGSVSFSPAASSTFATGPVEVTMSGLPFTYTVDDLVVKDFLGNLVASTSSNYPTISNFVFAASSTGNTLSFSSNKLFNFSVATTTPIIEPIIVVPPAGGGGGGGGGGGSAASTQTPLLDSSTTTPGLVLGASTFRFPRFLRPGMRGTDVQELQERLKLEGFFLGETTKYYGPLTKQSVMKYQRAHKIRPVTGIVARATLASLNAGASSSLATK